MRESTDRDNSLRAKEVFDAAINSLKEKKINDVKESIQYQCLHNLLLFEPYLIQIMNFICKESGYISNKNRLIRENIYEIMISN